jgi:trimeric autotransporter adhesin
MSLRAPFLRAAPLPPTPFLQMATGTTRASSPSLPELPSACPPDSYAIDAIPSATRAAPHHPPLARLIALIFAWTALAASVGRAQIVDPNLWMTDTSVQAAVLDGNTLYIAGGFSRLMPYTGSLVAIDSNSGTRRGGWPSVVGDVDAIVPDGEGGWFVGGNFTSIAGVSRTRVAHVRADGTLDAWNPVANGAVSALAVGEGVVYAGGSFSSIGGQARNCIAALDIATGQATSWNPDAGGTTPSVGTLAVGNGVVYAGGGFTSIGGQIRNDIAALDTTTGLATAWNPSSNGNVDVLLVANGLVYAGGIFTSIGGQSRKYIASLDPSTGLATVWDASVAGSGYQFVSALATGSGVVYAGGQFTNIGGQPRNSIAALDVTTGQATGWNPGSNGNVNTLFATHELVYVGGSFTSIGGQPRWNLAALDISTGQSTAWNPNPNNAVYAIGVNSGTVYAGGAFAGVGGEVRGRIAAIDVTTGQPTAWNPNSSSDVAALALGNGTLYTGGYFTSIGGQERNYLAALDVTTGEATAWSPNADAPVYALAVSGSTVYVGGQFGNIDGQARRSIAAIDANTGLATAWNPGSDGILFSLVAANGVVYAGGSFTMIGGDFRNGIASFDTATGLPTHWSPRANGNVFAIATGADVVYVGGVFSSIGGQAGSTLATIDATTALAVGNSPSGDGGVHAITLNGETLYVGGSFSTMGGQARSGIAALDVTTGLATTWNPGVDPSAYVYAIAAANDAVYVGGSYRAIAGQPRVGLARLLPTPSSSPNVAVLSANDGETANIGSLQELSWTATADYPGVQSVDVYLSRNGGTGPWELLAAGAPNTGHYDWKVTGPASSGTCYLRVDARDYAGQIGSDISDAGFTVGSSTAGGGGAALSFALSPVAPNPVRGHGILSYAIPRRSQVRLTLLDVQGRVVSRVFDGEREAGRYTTPIEAGALSSGLYFARLQTEDVDLRQRVVVIK